MELQISQGSLLKSHFFSRFFGYFFMVLHLGQVIGNILSSLILTTGLGYNKPEDRVEKTYGLIFCISNSKYY